MAKMSGGEELINHYGAVRLRAVGSGNLKMIYSSFDNVKMNILVDVPLQLKSNKEPNRLANFTQQKARLEIRTIEIDEIFHISKILIFAKPVAKSFPEMS